MRAIIVFSIYSIWSNHVRENDSEWVKLVLKMSDLVWRKNYAFLQKSKSITDCGLKIYWGRLKISLEIGCFWIFDVVVLSMFSFWNWKKKRNVFRSFAWDFVGRALKSFFCRKKIPSLYFWQNIWDGRCYYIWLLTLRRKRYRSTDINFFLLWWLWTIYKTVL